MKSIRIPIPSETTKEKRHSLLTAVLFALLSLLVSHAYATSAELLTTPLGRILQVGQQRAIKTLAEVAKRATNGDTIEVDAGEYYRDVAVWTQNDLKLKAINGRVRLVAGGASAESKAIWVIRGGNIQVEGFDFIGAAVGDHNGAGIRFERGNLTIRRCRFFENENGILTGGHAKSTLEIENSEFGYNGFGDGKSHNLYVGAISRLSVTGSYFHHAKVGHLLKSRAAENRIFYNRLTDETDGTASYELEFPDGGTAYVLGNIIQQSSTTENPNMISYGAEGNRWPANELILVNNTLIDNFPKNGVFLRMKPGVGKVLAINNLLIGRGKLEDSGPGDYRNNFNVSWDESALAVRDDYRLRVNSKLRGKAIIPPSFAGISLKPEKEYLHPSSVRKISVKKLSPGAYQSSFD